MKIIRPVVATCAIIALVAVCMAGEPQGCRVIDEDDVASVALDLSDSLPALPGEALLAPPIQVGSVHVDNRPPPSRLTTAEVFRPPRVRG